MTLLNLIVRALKIAYEKNIILSWNFTFIFTFPRPGKVTEDFCEKIINALRFFSGNERGKTEAIVCIPRGSE